MIITLTRANFSASNIGTLSTWRITRSLGIGATYEGVTSVDKGAAFSGTVTIADGYELGAAGVTVTMGGSVISAATVNGNVITISIASVTGNVVIKVPTVNVSTGDEDIVYDESTVAFLTASGIQDEEMKNKLDTLVISLKEASLWNKIDALYPCVGTTFEQMSYNLKNPNTYRLEAAGTTTIVPNVSMYSASQIKSANPDYIPGDDFHVLGCSGSKLSDIGASFFAIAPTNAGGTNGGILTLWQSDKITLKTENNTNWLGSTSGMNLEGDDFVIGSLTSGIVCNGQNLNATKNGTPTISTWTAGVDDYMLHNCFNYDNHNTPGKASSPYIVKMSGFGRGLTIEEMQTYSTILNTFKTMY